MEDLLLIVGFVLGATILSFVCGMNFGISCQVETSRQEAISAGVAHWSINPVTGEKKFEWGRE